MNKKDFNPREKKMEPEQLSAWVAKRKKCVVFSDKRKEIPRKSKYKKKVSEFENSSDF